MNWFENILFELKYKFRTKLLCPICKVELTRGPDEFLRWCEEHKIFRDKRSVFYMFNGIQYYETEKLIRVYKLKAFL